MLTLDTSHLKEKKNLLAFSAGVDSSALFFLLIQNSIVFDIALVNYGTRENSDKEELHAKVLAKKYNLTCYTVKAPEFTTHFEKNARDFRYDFFKKLIEEYNYTNLLTAHQLNDQLEWLLMRLTKGAGVSELIGLKSITKRENYYLVRPLLEYSKDELFKYLDKNSYPYFIDESNADNRYERNRFRNQFSNALIEQYCDGIRRSMEYLKNDKEILEDNFENILSKKELRVVKLHSISAKSRAVDSCLKELGYLLSASQRKNIEKEDSLVVAGLWAIELKNNLLYIAPYIRENMPKKFKEECRVRKVPSKIRPYIYKESIPLFLLS